MSSDSAIPFWREEVWDGQDSSVSYWFRLDGNRYQVSGRKSFQVSGNRLEVVQLQVFVNARWINVKAGSSQYKSIMAALRADGKVV